ncbi:MULTISPECIES: exodeoxyribonuclease VII large subunit [Asticcacaulis]|uniref:exodeoxyribonuclease VII large subunit n=1 Tax=Asticcacaulis TaxID=76890 RepID=UPI001AE43AC8|nr:MULTISPECIES: exodeoxyribonuclease VII large subunit [Asticcacaulis]MBP2160649.1 exodeoxyribonuclease VII large subunit [Asticcacaulis solisilvae]MDR6801694.1 exodeoxyribonuclease VII large subunit [Asticcacaulis sp. BE141]
MADLLTESSNAAPYSVSELAGALKRTLETTYDHVRLRGEISKVTRHSSGHVYLTIKDDKAAIDGVVWKGQVSRLQAQPDHGLEVIVTGRITTFPASSKYQIVIEQMEVAGVGALLAQLERLKQKLHAEGLFAADRKRPLPFAPKVIGVVTSPTGAVIRDILHRIRDRWPCRVIVWPVVVQGDTAPPQVIRALKGLEAGENGLPRPDVIIVARGGGSVEDLWPFNDEGLARAVSACTIPVISAVGHETDTTLIDYVSDRRAPTPTGAAEMATPVLGELRAFVSDLERRRQTIISRIMEVRRERVALLSRALPKPQELIDTAQQRLDFVAHRLSGALSANLNAHHVALQRTSARFRPGLLEQPQRLKTDQLAQLSQRLAAAMTRKLALTESHARLPQLTARLGDGLKRIATTKGERLPDLTRRMDESLRRATMQKGERLPELSQRLGEAITRSLSRHADRLKGLDQLRLSLNPDRPLELGFARVNRKDGQLVTAPDMVSAGEGLELTFKGSRKLDVTVGEGAPPAPKPVVKKPGPPPQQGSLF